MRDCIFLLKMRFFLLMLFIIEMVQGEIKLGMTPVVCLSIIPAVIFGDIMPIKVGDNSSGHQADNDGLIKKQFCFHVEAEQLHF